MKLISIIMPAYNEEAGLSAAISRVGAVITALVGKYEFEVIILDNNSSDRTGEIAKQQSARDIRWKYVRQSRNFGAESSMLAGLDHAEGEAVINVFSDLQDPPEKIPHMLTLWEEGAEVVYGVVQERNDSNLLKTIGAKLAYRLIQTLADTNLPPNATDFRLLDRSVVKILRDIREPDRYLRGLVHWIGFRQVPFLYDRAKRTTGASTANLAYCLGFTLHAIVCFSSKPVRLATLFGFLLTAFSLFLSGVYVVLYFVRPPFLVPPPPGLTTLILLGLFIVEANSLFLGVIGEYVGRIYNQGKQRPIYLIAEKVNFRPEK